MLRLIQLNNSCSQPKAGRFWDLPPQNPGKLVLGYRVGFDIDCEKSMDAS